MLFALVACLAVSAEPLAITSPKPHQVIQRVGFEPKANPPSLGYADVVIRIDAQPDRANWEYRAVRLDQAADVAWTPVAFRKDGDGLTASARVAAGGWYRLEVRSPTHQGAVEPVGVGEVFVVAGQSYATNCNDERLNVADAQKRVTAFDSAKGTWAVANDPQPAPDGSDGGSIWPPLGDALAKEFGVPVAFANVAVGATSTAQWAPGGPLHNRLVAAGKTLGGFRAVLWQQGESDVIAKTTTAQYVANVRAIRHAAAAAWGTQPPWLLAKSTLHPTVYTDPTGEGRIRAAIDELIVRPGFGAGPDTDSLAGENRGGPKSRRHFSAVGQRNAAAMWFDVLKKRLNSPPPLQEMLSEFDVSMPAWASPMVRRESSVLLQREPNGPIVARLAFPAVEVLEIATADRRHVFAPGDAKLSDDGLTMTFAKPGPVTVITGAEMFVPKGSPQSYASRVGHPEQSLMYHPGRWFHDRDIEVTYRRRDKPAALPVVVGTLPKTLARLKAGEAFTLGVSGDSISTGLDASAKVGAIPNQPGFAELVATQLQASFDCPVTLKNRAVGGWSVANGVADLDKLLAEKPHLIVVAYGMNDVGRRDPKWYGTETKKIVDRIRAAEGDIEVLLVSSMLGNADWTATPREQFGKYRDELKALVGPGVALADVTAVWELFLRNKHDHDLTGNGLNHPNDFGHRLYAQAIMQALADQK